MNYETVEHVAKMIKLFRQGRVVITPPQVMGALSEHFAYTEAAMKASLQVSIDALDHTEIIDVTKVISEVMRDEERLSKNFAEGAAVSSDEMLKHLSDKVVAPPWLNALLVYSHLPGEGTGGLLTFSAMDGNEVALYPGRKWSEVVKMMVEMDTHLASTYQIDYDRVRWLCQALLYIHDTRYSGFLTGPITTWTMPVYEDGTPVWCIPKGAPFYEGTLLDTLMMLNTLNICNASNVILDVPKRPRPVQRRLDRIAGVRITEIHVRSLKDSTGSKGLVQNPGVPLTTVRGHFAEYGPKYGKKLLFGRIEGRFWIPQHVRGDAAFGAIEHSYDVAAE